MYGQLDQVILKEKDYTTIVMGDFNGKVGSSITSNKIVGKFGLGSRNRNGDYLVEFANTHQLSIMNTFFQKRAARKWTWIGPNNSIKNEIDYILCSKPDKIQDVEVVNQFNTGSDHRLLRGKLIIDTKEDRKNKLAPRRKPIRQLGEDVGQFQLRLRNRFEILAGLEDIDKVAEEITTATLDVADEMKAPPSSRPQKLSTPTKDLLVRRRKMKKAKNNSVEYSQRCKAVRSNMRKDIREYNTTMIKKTIESNRSVNLLFRRMAPKKQITSLKGADGRIITNRQKITQRAKDYEYLYKSEDDQSRNMKTEEEGEEIEEITPEEVRRALIAMPNGKAPGADAITTELIKYGGSIMTDVLAQLFTKCLEERRIL